MEPSSWSWTKVLGSAAHHFSQSAKRWSLRAPSRTTSPSYATVKLIQQLYARTMPPAAGTDFAPAPRTQLTSPLTPRNGSAQEIGEHPCRLWAAILNCLSGRRLSAINFFRAIGASSTSLKGWGSMAKRLWHALARWPAQDSHRHWWASTRRPDTLPMKSSPESEHVQPISASNFCGTRRNIAPGDRRCFRRKFPALSKSVWLP